jgi:glycosyltransferase involved in cell wall biosynthesis
VQIDVICPSSEPNYEVLEKAGINLLDITIDKNYDRESINTLRTLLTGRNYDILHVFNNRALSNGIFAARGLPVKLIAYRGIVGNQSFFDPVSWFRFLNPRIDRIVCVCDAIKVFFLNMKPAFLRIPEKKLLRIYKGHSLDWYQDIPGDIQQFGIPEGAFVVGCVANFRPRKGIDDLIDSLHYLPSHAPIHYLIVGNMDSKKLKKQIAASPHKDRIHLAGFRSDAPALMAACDIFCLPSKKREGLPRSVIEAMSYGTAPIVTDSGGSPELIVDGVSGLVAASSNPASLADAITRLYQDPELRASMSKAARERIRNDFTIEATVRQTLALYEELAAEIQR